MASVFMSPPLASLKSPTGAGVGLFLTPLASTQKFPRFDKANERRNRGVLGEGGAEWKVAAASLHDDVLLDSEERHE